MNNQDNLCTDECKEFEDLFGDKELKKYGLSYKKCKDMEDFELEALELLCNDKELPDELEKKLLDTLEERQSISNKMDNASDGFNSFGAFDGFGTFSIQAITIYHYGVDAEFKKTNELLRYGLIQFVDECYFGKSVYKLHDFEIEAIDIIENNEEIPAELKKKLLDTLDDRVNALESYFKSIEDDERKFSIRSWIKDKKYMLDLYIRILLKKDIYMNRLLAKDRFEIYGEKYGFYCTDEEIKARCKRKAIKDNRLKKYCLEMAVYDLDVHRDVREYEWNAIYLINENKKIPEKLDKYLMETIEERKQRLGIFNKRYYELEYARTMHGCKGSFKEIYNSSLEFGHFC